MSCDFAGRVSWLLQSYCARLCALYKPVCRGRDGGVDEEVGEPSELLPAAGWARDDSTATCSCRESRARAGERSERGAEVERERKRSRSSPGLPRPPRSPALALRRAGTALEQQKMRTMQCLCSTRKLYSKRRPSRSCSSSRRLAAVLPCPGEKTSTALPSARLLLRTSNGSSSANVTCTGGTCELESALLALTPERRCHLVATTRWHSVCGAADVLRSLASLPEREMKVQ